MGENIEVTKVAIKETDLREVKNYIECGSVARAKNKGKIINWITATKDLS